MPDLAELHLLNRGTVTNTSLLVRVGVDALWEAAIYGDLNNLVERTKLLEPAAGLLGRAVSLELSRGNEGRSAAYVTAQNHLAHLAIFKSWTLGEPVTPGHIDTAYHGAAGLLRSTNKRSEGTAPYSFAKAGITYQLLMNRLRDTKHIALPAPTFASAHTNWRDEPRRYHPRSNVFVSASNGTLLPSAIRAKFPDSTKREYEEPGFQQIGLGQWLIKSLWKGFPGHREKMAAMGKTAKCEYALETIATMLLDEEADQQLPAGASDFLAQESAYAVKYLETKATMQ